MYKKLLCLIMLIIISLPVYPKNAGNTIDKNEFPNSELVGPFTKNNDNVISGSVVKDIDMNLGDCIRIALGNNPEINAAFQDILASDARIK